MPFRGPGSRPGLFLIVALLGLLPVLPILVLGSPVLNNDMLVAYYCYFADFHRNWSWDHPLVFWSSSYQTGMPMHAYWQSGYLYPVTWLLFGPLPPQLGMHLFYAFHFALGIGGFLALGPRLRLRLPASLWAGIAFSLSGTMLARYEHATFLAGWAYLPLVLAAFLALRDAPGPGALLRYGAVVALQALGGHPQASATTALLIAVFSVPVLAGPVLRRVPMPRSGRRAGWVFAGHALALILCLPLVMPFIGLVGKTDRYDGAAWEGKEKAKSAGAVLEDGAFGFEKFSTGALRPLHLLSLGAAHALGSPSNASWWGGEAWGEVFLYLGVLALFFCFSASWTRAGPDMRLLWMAGLLGLWLAYGAHLGASQILYHVPGFNNFRRPGRYLILVVLALAALSAHGFQRWSGKPRGGRLPASLALAGLAGTILFLALRLLPGAGSMLLDAVKSIKPLDPAKDYAAKLAALAGRLAVDAAVTALSGMALWRAAVAPMGRTKTPLLTGRRRIRPAVVALFAVLSLDLLRIHWDHFYPFPRSFYRDPPATAALLDSASGPFWRVSHYLEYPGLEMWRMHNDPLAALPLFQREKDAMGFGIHAVFGYRHVSAHLPLLWRWEAGMSPADKGARYLFSNRDMEADGGEYAGDSLRQVGHVGEVRVYELAGWKPRFEVNARAGSAQGERPTGIPPPLPSSVSSPLPSPPRDCPEGFAGWDGLCVREIRDGHLLVSGAFTPGDTLRVRERAYPGWRYRLPGGPWLKALETEDHFLALPVLSAADAIELRYSPVDFLFWASISIPAASILMGIAYRLRKMA